MCDFVFSLFYSEGREWLTHKKVKPEYMVVLHVLSSVCAVNAIGLVSLFSSAVVVVVGVAKTEKCLNIRESSYMFVCMCIWGCINDLLSKMGFSH